MSEVCVRRTGLLGISLFWHDAWTLRAAAVAAALLLAAPAAAYSVIHSHAPGPKRPYAALVADTSGNLYGTTQSGGTWNSGTVFRIKTDGTGFVVLHSFAGGSGDGGYPWAALILDDSGTLYGTTEGGGASNRGTVFKIKTDGSSFSVLHSFAGGNDDGQHPEASLILDTFGNLYGTTPQGGASDRGTVFRVKTDGTGFLVLHSFAGGWGDGLEPYASLVLDASGNLYGTTYYGSSWGAGTVFTIRTDGAGFSVLHSFAGGAGDGRHPQASLILDASGSLYGTTEYGGASDLGTVFTLKTDGTGFSLLHAFAGGGGDGEKPWTSLILDDSGSLYGTTQFGASSAGTVFRIKTDGTDYSLLHSFAWDGGDGLNPWASLILDASGNLYGTTEGGGASDAGAVFAMKTDGSGFSVLHSFAGGAGDGRNPNASLVLDASGNLYGTTRYGGASEMGIVFTMNTDGTGFSVLHSFAGGTGDGAYPFASLILDASGNLYGTTPYGGTSDGGTVFTIKTNGPGLSVLHSFAGSEGVLPLASLILDASGSLYGITEYGGDSGRGTVFTLKTDGTGFSVLHSFAGGAGGGGSHQTSLILDASGNLYGTTNAGGESNLGTVFTLKSDGTGFSVLHSFAGGASDGQHPSAPLILDASGSLFGTTEYGGASDNGTVYTLKTDGTGFSILHAFAGGAGDGRNPYASLILDAAGSLHGTTCYGGASENGTIYTLKTDGTEFSLLHSFAGSPGDGQFPLASLILDASGNLYGTTYFGGSLSLGTEFTLALPPSPMGFFTLAPCRLLDTRGPDGALGGPALQAGQDRSFVVTKVEPCEVPPTARALSLNVTVTEPTASGHLALHPGGGSPQTTSTISFSTGQTRANNAVVLLPATGTGALGVYAASTGTVHVIVDVNGYYQ